MWCGVVWRVCMYMCVVCMWCECGMCVYVLCMCVVCVYSVDTCVWCECGVVSVVVCVYVCVCGVMYVVW